MFSVLGRHPFVVIFSRIVVLVFVLDLLYLLVWPLVSQLFG